MSAREQLRLAGAALAAPWRAGGRTRGRLRALFLAAVVVAGLAAFLIVAGEAALWSWAIEHLLPGPARPIARGLGFVVGLVSRRVAALADNLELGGVLLLLSILLLPLRERLSIALEEERELTAAPAAHVRWRDALADIVVPAAAFVALELALFALGYSREPWRQTTAAVASYAVVFLSCAMDFVPPLLARHGVRASGCFAALARAPLFVLAFGAAITAPGLLALALTAGRASLLRFVLVLAANVAGVAWGTLAGTVAAARLLPSVSGRAARSRLARGLGWAAFAVVLAGESYAAVGVAASLGHKAELLNCRYHLVASSVRVNLPSVSSLLSGQVVTGAHAIVEIENPTDHAVAIEHTRLELARGGVVVARAALGAGEVPAGQTARYPIDAPVVLGLGELRRALKRSSPWDLTLYVEVEPGLELPIYLTDRPR